ncbi:MAG TPA: PspC domain-containing protein [Parafilimonas sp.]|nr:PspC domain-containing protein [Parafilimonas sp.]
MKKVININFQGRVIPIEETAYEILKQYIESLSQFFANEEGKDEIINDIEGRIAELFSEVLNKGNTCVTDADVQAIIHSIGRPEDFDADLNENAGTKTNTANASEETYTYTEHTHLRPERLYRDENNKLLGGVCAGLANYFNIDKLVVRILFILFTFGFGFGFIIYLILWVAIPSTASTTIGSMRKRLFRDPENKLIAGVCGGLSAYFGVNVWIPRLLFLIPFLSFVTSWHHWGVFNFPNFINLSFSPGATLIYIILWLITPEASTTSDKLEMKGEKVDLNSIKNTIQKDMEGFTDRAKTFGKEVGDRAAQMGGQFGKSGKQFSAEVGHVAKRSGTVFGNVITLFFKIIAYFVIALVLISLVLSLFGVGIAVTGLLPFKTYLISDGWQSILAWGTFIFFIWVPVIGIITFIIRRISKSRGNSSVMRFGFGAMWILGLFCFIGLLASLRSDFSYHNAPVENNVHLTNPQVNKLEVRYAKNNRYYFNTSFLNLQPFATIDEDTVFVRNIHIRILKSDNDSFQVTTLKMAYGASRAAAEQRASHIIFNVDQKDSTLYFDRGIPIDKNDKFRNQSVYATIYVPVGKRIIVTDDIGWNNDFHFEFGNDVNDWDWSNYDNGYGWDHNVEYVMTEDGLKRVHPEVSDEDNNDDDQQEQPADTTQKDTTRYHYQPADNKITKPAKRVKVINASQKISTDKISDITTSFLERLSL